MEWIAWGMIKGLHRKCIIRKSQFPMQTQFLNIIYDAKQRQ